MDLTGHISDDEVVVIAVCYPKNKVRKSTWVQWQPTSLTFVPPLCQVRWEQTAILLDECWTCRYVHFYVKHCKCEINHLLLSRLTHFFYLWLNFVHSFLICNLAWRTWMEIIQPYMWSCAGLEVNVDGHGKSNACCADCISLTNLLVTWLLYHCRLH